MIMANMATAALAVQERPTTSTASSTFLTQWRPAFWAVVLGLTATILAYPVIFKLDAVVVWSSRVLPNLTVLGFIFYLWASLLVALVLLPIDEQTGRWHRLGLVLLAGLVLRGFWGIVAPLQGQAIGHAGTTAIWQSAGHVISGPGVSYIEWPGVSISHSVITQVTGLGIISASALYNAVIAMLIAATSYVFLLRVLKESRLAALASLVILEGSLALNVLLSGGPIALVFLVSFLVVHFYRGRLERDPSALLIALLLLSAAAIVHLHTSMHFAFILFGLWALALIPSLRSGLTPSFATVVLFFMIPVIWLIYTGDRGFGWIVRGAWGGFLDPARLLERFLTLFTIGEANFGESVPFWYSRPRLLWFGVAYVAGGLFWLWSLVRIRRMDLSRRAIVAAFGGVVLLAALSLFVSPSGFAELQRLLQTGVFFTAAFLLLLLVRWRHRYQQVALLSLALLLVGLSLPSFLANGLRVNSTNSQPVDLAAGEWLSTLYGTGRGFHVVGWSGAVGPVQFYLHEAKISIEPQLLSSKVWTEQAAWDTTDSLLATMNRSLQLGDSTVFVHSPRLVMDLSDRLGIPYDHPRWTELEERLARSYSQSYNNGKVRIFTSKVE